MKCARCDHFIVSSRVLIVRACSGNHEVDDPSLGFNPGTVDSGGECGVPYRHYFPQPTASAAAVGPPVTASQVARATLPVADKVAQQPLWGSWDSGSIHFVSFATEQNYTAHSAQLQWLERDLASVNRTKYPFVVFAGHRPYLVSDSCSGWNNNDAPYVGGTGAPRCCVICVVRAPSDTHVCDAAREPCWRMHWSLCSNGSTSNLLCGGTCMIMREPVRFDGVSAFGRAKMAQRT
jgi:hypothetical protein